MLQQNYLLMAYLCGLMIRFLLRVSYLEQEMSESLMNFCLSCLHVYLAKRIGYKNTRKGSISLLSLSSGQNFFVCF